MPPGRAGGSAGTRDRARADPPELRGRSGSRGVAIRGGQGGDPFGLTFRHTASHPRSQRLKLRGRQASSAALDTQRWCTLAALVRLPSDALGAEAHERALAAAYSALSTANQEAMVPLLACLRALQAAAVRQPERLESALRALGAPPREGTPRSDMLAALAGALGRACWAALVDCRGGTAAAALAAAFLDTALAPELFACASDARCAPEAPEALAARCRPDRCHTSAKCAHA